MTPLHNPILPEENLYNESHIRTRNVVERSYGMWKRRFPILRLEMRLKMETIQTIIVATAVLNNIAIDMRDEEPEEEITVDDDEGPNADEEIFQPANNTGAAVRQNLIQYFSTLL
ncbi:putative nuclease HARBI1 [Anoplophora glabripennis]|uniref:putative nuclease HARBI1 n=1 Tax=Anoplophora glabripennis TaxID=217634 RepID=UPI000C771C51|nr:putative nuclease HARBI1 [Anoplophora glabripennis]